MNRWYALSGVLTATALVAALYFGLARPDVFREKVPVHWDLYMNADRWVERDELWPTLLIFPGVMGLMALLMWILPLVSPKNFEVERFSGTWCYIMTLIVGMFGYMFALQMWIAIDENAWFERPFLAGFFVLFALLSNRIGKVQRNFWMGVRTPWTLASDAVWVRTHRLAAWTWVPTGILGAALVLIGVPYWIPFVLVVPAVLWPALYSLILYKQLQHAGKL